MSPLEEKEEDVYMDRHRILRVNIRTLLSEYEVPSNMGVETSWIVDRLVDKINEKQGTKDDYRLCIRELEHWDTLDNPDSTFKKLHQVLRKCLIEIIRNHQMVPSKTADNDITDDQIYAQLSELLRTRKE